MSHSVAGLAQLELVVTDFGSDRRVLVLQDHAKHPRVARGQRILNICSQYL